MARKLTELQAVKKDARRIKRKIKHPVAAKYKESNIKSKNAKRPKGKKNAKWPW
jgi:hypothetical protein